MKYFKSDMTNRIIQFIDQCYYCKHIKSCGLAQPFPCPFKCPDFDEDTNVVVGGPGINIEEEKSK